MTPSLRKYHRGVWYLMVVALPVFFIAAVMALPSERLAPEAPNYQPKALPMVVKTAASELFVARFRMDPATEERQMEIELLRPLTAAAVLVYLTKSEAQPPTEGVLLGTIASQNVYRFKIGHELAELPYVLLYDPIKNKLIQTLHLASTAPSTNNEQ